MQEGDAILEMVRKIAEAGDPDAVMLYGSHARNAAGPSSDVDLLVIFRRLDDRRRMVARLYEALAGSPFPKDIVICTRDEYERFQCVVNTIHWVNGREGKVIYER